MIFRQGKSDDFLFALQNCNRRVLTYIADQLYLIFNCSITEKVYVHIVRTVNNRVKNDLLIISGTFSFFDFLCRPVF